MKTLPFFPALLAGALLLALSAHAPMASAPAPAAEAPGCELAVLASPGDAFYPLAQEIAAAEGVPLAGDLARALECRPRYLLWMVSPAGLSDETMVGLGLEMRRLNLAVSPGILTGSTPERARALYERRSRAGAGAVFAVNAASPPAHIEEGRIFSFSGDERSSAPLDRASLAAALGSAGYLTFTGHGSGRSWRIDEDITLGADDIPALDGAVVSAGACQTLRPWVEDSIALRFADQGAAAYTGFLFSPNEGYWLGQFDGLPLRYTWPAFPVGTAVQVQNRGTLRAYALFPFHFVLGDPRTALQAGPPYTVLEDRVEGDRRVLRLGGVPAGVVPVRVPGGAAYRWVSAAGVTAAGDADLFYNSRMQTLPVGPDRFILVEHPGGELALELRPRAPWYWYPLDTLLDSLDHTFIFSLQSGGDALALGFAVLPLARLARLAVKKRLERAKLVPALLFGAGAAAAQTGYSLLRLSEVTVVSKSVVISPPGLAAGFVLGAAGALLFFHARSPRGRLAGLLAATFMSWAPLLFGLGLAAAFILPAFRPAPGVSLYSASPGLAALPAFLVTFAAGAWILAGMNAVTGKKARPS